MYNIIADLHTHSLASTHAYSTIKEMVDSAKEKGLYAIAITDHGPSLPDSDKFLYFEKLRDLPLIQNGVKFISGIELNVLDFEGNTDFRKEYNVDLVIASIHNLGFEGLKNPTIEKCNNLYTNLALNPNIHVIGHSGSHKYKYDYEKIIPIFKENNKLVEINSHTFNVRATAVDNCYEIAKVCKKYEAPIIVSSDAHFHTTVGEFTKALELLESIDFPEELIVNASVERLEAYLNEHTNINTRVF